MWSVGIWPLTINIVPCLASVFFFYSVAKILICWCQTSELVALSLDVRSSTNTWPSWQRSTLRPNSSNWMQRRPHFWQRGCASKLFRLWLCLLMEKQRTMWSDSLTWETRTSSPQRCSNGDLAVRTLLTTGEICGRLTRAPYVLWMKTFYLTWSLYPVSSGNLREPPTATQRSGTKFTKVEKKTIRGRGYDSDSEDDWRGLTVFGFTLSGLPHY